MDLKTIAALAIAQGGAMVDCLDESIPEHDRHYHPDGYREGDDCKFRDEQERKDAPDEGLGDGDGGGKRKRAKEIFDEYAGSLMRSDRWLYDNLGITDRRRADDILVSLAQGKVDEGKAFEKILGLVGEIPKGAWKPGAKKPSSSSGKAGQGLLDLGGMTQSPGGAFGQYYHAQGLKRYTQEKHDKTGLYKTYRSGGKALAREEDVPGLTPFHKDRPSFRETGTVPSSLTDDQLSHFRFTANGSTYPTVGSVGGRKYIVKHGMMKEGIRRNADLNNHVRTEAEADKFIRRAGLRAPVCTTFDRKSKMKDKDGRHLTDVVKIAEYVEGGVGLVPAWHHANGRQKDRIREQVVEAYPVMSFLENVDAFKNDNVLVDSDWNLWFVDNGACFDYRAQGGRKLLGAGENRMATRKDKTAKPWFYERNDPTSDVTGYLGLACAPDQQFLQEILSETTDRELVDAAKRYDFVALAKTLPQWLQKPGLLDYAQRLNEAVRNPPPGWVD